MAAMLGICTDEADTPEQVRLVLAVIRTSRVVEHVADLHATTEQFRVGGLDVGDDKIQALSGAGRRGSDVLAEDD
jgi:hypothetical protein